MSDNTEVLNWDMTANEEPPNIVECVRQLYKQILSAVELAQERHRDPNWHLEDVHIASKEIADLMLSDETPLEERAYLARITYAGQKWVQKDDE